MRLLTTLLVYVKKKLFLVVVYWKNHSFLFVPERDVNFTLYSKFQLHWSSSFESRTRQMDGENNFANRVKKQNPGYIAQTAGLHQ